MASFLRWKQRSLICNLSYFLRQAFSAINFPPNTASAASHKFSYVVFHFSLMSGGVSGNGDSRIVSSTSYLTLSSF